MKKELEKRIKELENENFETKKALNAERSRSENFRNTIGQLKEKIEENNRKSKEEKDNLLEEKKSLEIENMELKSKVLDLQKTMSDSDKNVKEIIRQMELQKQESENEVNKLKDEKNELLTKVYDSEKELEEVKRSKIAIINNCRRYKENIKLSEAEHGKLRMSLYERDKENEALKEENEKLKSDKNSILKENEKLKEDLVSAKFKIEKLEKENSTLTEKGLLGTLLAKDEETSYSECKKGSESGSSEYKEDQVSSSNLDPYSSNCNNLNNFYSCFGSALGLNSNFDYTK